MTMKRYCNKNKRKIAKKREKDIKILKNKAK